MRGTGWTALILLVLVVGALLLLPDLLRGSQETSIEPVRIEQPSTSERERESDRRDRRPPARTSAGTTASA